MSDLWFGPAIKCTGCAACIYGGMSHADWCPVAKAAEESEERLAAKADADMLACDEDRMIHQIKKATP